MVKFGTFVLSSCRFQDVQLKYVRLNIVFLNVAVGRIVESLYWPFQVQMNEQFLRNSYADVSRLPIYSMAKSEYINGRWVGIFRNHTSPIMYQTN